MKEKRIHIPQAAEEILKKLSENGYEAYIVGGYVRDTLLGRECGDIDITTNALPDDVIRIFGSHYISKSGLAHGTVGVIHKGESYEITTYRIDGDYKDHRHPDGIVFSKSLIEDLTRRDFTVNTLYYGLSEGVGDKCGGLDDLQNKTIRAVGDPVMRFTEDSLRILRGLRFASQLGFEINDDTLQGMAETKDYLSDISAERISVEVIKMICAPFFFESVKKYTDTFSDIFRCIFSRAGISFTDDAFTKLLLNSAECTEKVSGSVYLKLASFLCRFDIAFTDRFTDAQIGDMTKKLLKSLKCSGKIVNNVHYLVQKHQIRILDDKKAIANTVCESSPEMLLELLSLQKAYCGYHEMSSSEIEKTEVKAKDLILRGECLIPSQLNINGRDIIALGCNDGKSIGNILEELYRQVIEDKLKNDKKVLSDHALRILKSSNNDDTTE